MLLVVALLSVALEARAQTVVFNDTFGAGSLVNSNPTSPAAPLISQTAYQQISGKAFSPNPPTIASGHLRYGIAATSSGFNSIEALFTQYPVTLSNLGEYIELTVTFTNQAGMLTANANGTLLFALHNGAQTQPVPGGLNSTSDTYAGAGNAQSWAGYISRILYTGANHQICSRAGQGAVARDQDVLYNFNSPAASTIGALTASTLGALTTGAQYTEVFRVTKTAAAAVTIVSSLYQGADTTGPQLFTQTVTSSSIPVSTFDALAIGYRHTGSVASVMDVNTIKVVTTGSTTVVPVITQHPASQTVGVGDAVTFSVVASGGGAALSYQWQKDSANISGATSASYSIASAAQSHAGSYTVIVTDAAGSTTSNAAVLTVTTTGVAPSITQQPASATVLVGGSNTFTAQFTGTAPVTANWQKSTDGGANYTDIAGTTTGTSPTSYTISNAKLSDAAMYRLFANNAQGSATSNAATLTVNQAPSITTQPVGATIAAGASYTVSIVASGTPPPTYQWKLNGTNLSGATSSSYTITNASGANAGNYSCVTTNTAGTATSNSVYVGVLSPMTVSSLAPANGATGKNRDALLRITFDRAVSVGTTGRIRVFDAASPATPVDTIDLSTAITVTQFGTAYRYMAKTIGGANFNYMPVQVSGNTATIALHSSTALAYGKTYYVNIEPGVLLDSTGATFGGISDSTTWSFTTKAGGPAANAANISVATDGSGDFNTVQGAVDFVPYSPANTIPRTITIANGTYNELVRLRSGQNLVTMQGVSRAGVVIQYLTNNNTLISGAGSIGQRSVFGADPNDFTIQNLTIRNTTPNGGSQAEAFWVGNNAQRMTIYALNILSYQDTVMTNGGQAFFTDCYVEGDVDFVWGSGKTFFQNSELKMMLTGGIYAQARNSPATFPGYFFVNCQLTAAAGIGANSCYFARIDPAGFPSSQVALINCRMGPHIIAAGWQLNNASTAPSVKFWEYQSTDLAGTSPITVTGRPTYNNIATGVGTSTVLANQQIDAATADYFRDAVNAIGWAPRPIIGTQPASQTASTGQAVSFSVVATAPLAMTYQWSKDNVAISGATAATYAIASVTTADAGNYTVAVTNPAGSVTSSAAALSVNNAPLFTTQPASQTVLAGESATFTVAVAAPAGVTYQWFQNNVAISGATGTTYGIAATAPGDAGSYTVQATNASGTATSSAAILTVNHAPLITTPPASLSIYVGQGATFTVAATATPAATFQWYKNNVLIGGATSASYSIASAGISSAGSFTVTVTNSVGSVTSNAATLTVTDGAPPTIAAPAGGFFPLTLIAGAGGTAPLPDYTPQARTSDNVGVTSVTQSPAPGSARSLGTTTVTLTAQDAAGRTASLSFQVTVLPIGSPWPELKVDLSRFTQRPDTAAPHFIEWQFDPAFPARSFGPTGVLLRRAGAPGTQLDSNWYKFAIDSGALLALDGVFVKDVTTGNGQIEIVLSGLAAGHHTFAAYHNSVSAPATTTMSAISVAVNGVVQVASVTPSAQVTNDYDIATSYVEFDAVAGQDVVIAYAALGNGTPASANTPILNGFELDASDPAKRAEKPAPANDDEHVDGDSGSVSLSWTAAPGAVSHDLYLGTDAAAVTVANHASPFFYGNQSGTGAAVTGLDGFSTYFWRVDEVDAGGVVTRGEVWRFRIRHLAFPGAEGYGRFARGGRGGSVIEVTNLLDYNSEYGEAVIPGSYRAAIEATGPRTVVFRVSGLIRLKKPCTIGAANSYLTVAGQTAPGEGICLSQYSSGMLSAKDVIIRHMRMRLGDASLQAMDGMGMGGANHSIIDHCTISWTLDEGTSSRSAKNITFQRNIISEALQHSYHYASQDRSKYETHAFAASISGAVGSFHHNLIAHCTDRSWSLAGGLNQGGKYAGQLDLRNNVIYNWQARTTDGGVKECNFVNNYYKRGPAAGSVTYLMKPDAGGVGDRQQYYVTGNLMENVGGAILYEGDNWNAAGVIIPAGATQADIRVNAPFFPDYVTTHTARDAFKIVLSDVGANAQPDVIDRRIVQEVRDGTWTYKGTIATTPADPRYINSYAQPPPPNYNGIIDQPGDVLDATGSPNFPWPAYPTLDVPADADHDGMPDFWEAATGSNPNTQDHNADPDDDGYTALENYLNWLAAPHAITAPGAPVDLDLAPLTAGFSGATHSVSGATNGTVALLADGHTARFTPTGGFNGIAAFDFTVSADGTSGTRSAGICITPQATAFERRWQGSSGNVWDGSTANWRNGDASSAFQPGNAAVFEDTGTANSTIVLSGTLHPSSLTVSGATNYTFVGSGTLAGMFPLVKSGTGTLTLGGGHSFGSAWVQGGTLAITSGVFSVSGDITNQATVRLTGGAALNVFGAFVNNGLLDIMTGAQTLPLNFVNTGTVLDATLIRTNFMAKDGASFSVTIRGYAGHGYQLQRADTLTAPWISIGSVQPGTGSVLGFTDSIGATGAQKFYRVEVAP